MLRDTVLHAVLRTSALRLLWPLSDNRPLGRAYVC
jgi:hypothetical protein